MHPDGVRRVVGRLLTTALLLPLGAVVLLSGLDRLSAGQPALAAAVPAPFRWQANRAEAAVAILREDQRGAMVHAAQAVASDPVHPDATALLGAALVLKGDGLAAAAAFRQAAQFGWRNPMTQLYWFTAAVQSGEWAVAADRADAVLRTNPGYPQAEALLQALEQDPSGRQELAIRLARHPVWTSRYLDLAEDLPPEVAARRAEVVAQVSAARGPFGCPEVRRFVTQLLAGNLVSQARQVWNANCPGQLAEAGLHDPAFAALGRADASPFGWELRTTGDVEAVASGTGGIELVNSGSVSRSVLIQPMFVPAGRYRLVADVDGGTDDALVASIDCGSGSALPSATQGSLSREGGQVLDVLACDGRRLLIWVKRNSGRIQLRSLQLSPL